MSSRPAFAIELRRTSYKDATIEYREPSRSLEVYVEMSGVPEFDYVGVDSSFASWTHPSQPMSDADRERVRARIEEWAVSKHLRIGFGPPASLDEYLEKAIASGIEVSHGTDSQGRPTITLTAPARGRDAAVGGILMRLRRWLRL